jgi:hypothetical protein
VTGRLRGRADVDRADGEGGGAVAELGDAMLIYTAPDAFTEALALATERPR